MKRGYLIALSAAAALWAAVRMAPSADERAVRRADRLIARGAPRTDGGRRKAVELFGRLEALGDDARMEKLARLILAGPFTAQERAAAAAAADKTPWLWNDRLPGWKRDLLAAGGMLPQTAPVPVRLLFKSAPPGTRPWAGGNWGSAGELVDLGGWKAARMEPAGAGWRLDLRLAPDELGHRRHVVVRTAPWPAGRALGWTSFDVKGPGPVTVTVPPLPAASAPEEATASTESRRTRLAVIGVDGASWHVVLPLVQRGLLPHFGRLLREGASARLVSVGGETAYFSHPCIHTALTGFLPYKHATGKAFFGFIMRNAVPRLWRWADAAGLSVDTVGVWGTFPTEKVRGRMVSEAYFLVRGQRDPEVRKAFSDPKTAQFAAGFGIRPEDLARLKRFSDWAARYVKTVQPDALEAALDGRLPWIPLAPGLELDEQARLLYDRQIIRVASEFLADDPPDLLIAYLIGVDAVGHSFWHELEPGVIPEGRMPPAMREEAARLRARTAGRFLEAWREADAFLGQAMARAENVLVFSDHGMTGRRPGDIWPILTLDPARMRRAFAAAGGTPPDTADSQGEEGLFFRSPEAGSLEKFRAFLDGARLQDGARLLAVSPVEDRDGPVFSVRLNPAAAQGNPFKGLTVGGKPASFFDFADLSFLEAEHAGNGLLLLWGPGVRPGPLTEDARLADVTPTALRLLGLPLPPASDGRSLEEALTEAARAGGPARAARAPRAERATVSLLRSLRWKRMMKDAVTGGKK